MASRIGGSRRVAVSYVAVFQDSLNDDGGRTVSTGIIYLKSHPESFVKNLSEKIAEIYDDHPGMILISFSHTKLN